MKKIFFKTGYLKYATSSPLKKYQNMNSGSCIELDSMIEKDDEVPLRNIPNLKIFNEDDNDILSTKSARLYNHSSSAS